MTQRILQFTCLLIHRLSLNVLHLKICLGIGIECSNHNRQNRVFSGEWALPDFRSFHLNFLNFGLARPWTQELTHLIMVKHLCGELSKISCLPPVNSNKGLKLSISTRKLLMSYVSCSMTSNQNKFYKVYS